MLPQISPTATATHHTGTWRAHRRRRIVLCLTLAVALGFTAPALYFSEPCSSGACKAHTTIQSPPQPQCPISTTPLAAVAKAVGGAYWTWKRFQTDSANVTDRPFPRAFVIGAQKCGTTTLWEMMSTHPNVRIGIRNASEPSKELHYFDRRQEVYELLGLDWYLSHWDYLKHDPHWREYVLPDATPDYLAEGHLPPRRMIEAFPMEALQFRFIVMICNPMERAYSFWHHETQDSWKGWVQTYNNGFGAFVREYLSRMSKCRERLPSQLQTNELLTFQSCLDALPDLLYRGMYWQQLQVWFKYFERRQFLIVDKSQLFGKDSQYWQRKIRQHIGLPEHLPFRQPTKYESGHAKLLIDDPATYHMLDQFYAPFTAGMLRDAPLCGFNVTGARAWHDSLKTNKNLY